jgi:flagellar hook-associated protein 3 FlgL
MRVTANTFPNSLVEQLRSLSLRQNRLQNQAATGQRVELPEDDPVAMRRVLDLQSEAKTNDQYERNIARHQELATSTFEALKALKTVSDRAREIAIAADALKSPEDLTVISKEVTELIKQAVQIANERDRGDYIFGGTRTDVPPFQLTTASDGTVISVAYQGNTTQAESEIAEGVLLTTQVLGENNTASGPRGLISDSRVGADMFNHLIALQNNLLAANVSAIETTDRAALAQDEENLLFHIGNNGALQARLETTAALNRSHDLNLEALISKEADADLAQTLVKLTQTQTAYQAALQSGAQILGTSLLDYLR